MELFYCGIVANLFQVKVDQVPLILQLLLTAFPELEKHSACKITTQWTDLSINLINTASPHSALAHLLPSHDHGFSCSFGVPTTTENNITFNNNSFLLNVVYVFYICFNRD